MLYVYVCLNRMSKKKKEYLGRNHKNENKLYFIVNLYAITTVLRVSCCGLLLSV